MSKYFTDKKWIIIVAIICSVLWGSAFPVLKISYVEMGIESDTFGKILLAGIRFFLASIIVLFISRVLAKLSLKIDKQSLIKLSFLGLFQTALMYFFFYIGVSNTQGTKAAILGAAENFFVVILAHFIYKNDKINQSKVIGLFLGFLGIILANWGKGFSFEFTLTGEGFMIISTVSGAIATILSKKICSHIHPFIASGYQMMIGSLMLIILGVANNHNTLIFTSKATGLLIYSAFLSAIAFSLWFALLKYNKAGEVTIYRFMIPIAGVILSAILVPGESFNIYTAISLICVAIGVFTVNSSKNSKITDNNILEKKNI